MIDKTRFPLLRIPALRLAVHCWPVTKVQFERFLAETNQTDKYNDSWYEQVLLLNPRVSYINFSLENYEQLFITGILPSEALDFAQWLGEGFDLPTLEEWRAIFQNFQNVTNLIKKPICMCPQAKQIWKCLQEILSCSHTNTLADLSLMRYGVVEWVRYREEFVGLGMPRPRFQPNVWEPLKEPIRPINPNERLKYFGFRLVRRE